MIRNTVNRHLFYRFMLGGFVLVASVLNFVVFFCGSAQMHDPGISLCGTIFLLPGGFGIWYGCKWFFSACFWIVIRDQHPWIKPLHEFGEPFDAIDSIESDIKAGPLDTWGAPFSFTMWANVRPAVVLSPNWLIHFRKTSSAIIPLADIVWIYQQHGRHRNWWGGATSFHTVLIYGIRRGPYLIDLDDQEGANWLGERLVECRPEILFGDSNEYRSLEKRGMEAVKEAMMQRREEYERLSDAEKEEWRNEALDDYVQCVHAWEV